MENKRNCGYCDNIVIHNWQSAKGIKATVSLRKGKKIVFQFVMADVDAVLSYMLRQPFCYDVPFRVINHK